MADKIIDADYTEVNEDGTTNTQNAETTPETPETQTPAEGGNGGLLANLWKHRKKIGLGLMMIGGGYLAYKGHQKLQGSLPDSIKGPSSNGDTVLTVITGCVPKRDLTDEELTKWNEAESVMADVMHEASERMVNESLTDAKE